MKIAPLRNDTSNKGKQPPLIPLVPTSHVDELDKENSTSFSLRTNIRDADSPKYKVNCRILQGDEDLAAILRWVRTVERVLTGLGLTALAPRQNIIETMMRGTPLSLFRASLHELAEAAYNLALRNVDPANAAAETAAIRANGVVHYAHDDHFTLAVNSLINHLAPKKSLQRVRRYLRRECRKPADMKVRAYYQHILRINMEDIPMLPPFAADQHLRTDEIMDIVLFGTPRSWQREMDRQGFDPIDNTMSQVIDFLEQIETSEDFEGQAVKSKTDKSKSSKKPASSSHGQKKSGDQKHCSFHGWGGHSSEECYKLQGDAKRQKGSKGSSKYSNKTWSRNDSAQSQKELATFVKKAVAAGIKEGTSSAKKRKSDMDLNAFEVGMDADLKDFNYQDMDDLKIETDDEVSV
jgi:hypothetical protein